MPILSTDEPWLLACQDIPGLSALSRLLWERKLPVRIAASGASLLSVAAGSDVPALILLGTRMPDMGAVVACSVLKMNPATASIPVCILADANAENIRVDAVRAGAAEFVVYPWDLQEVMLRFSRQLNSINAAGCTHAVSDRINEVSPWSREQELVWAAQQYLTHNHDDAPPVRELARLMGSTEGALQVAFHGILGISVYEYMRIRNLRCAAAMLSEGEQPVVEIAEVTGYSDAANFSTAFRRFTGVAPTTYREQARLATGSIASC